MLESARWFFHCACRLSRVRIGSAAAAPSPSIAATTAAATAIAATTAIAAAPTIDATSTRATSVTTTTTAAVTTPLAVAGNTWPLAGRTRAERFARCALFRPPALLFALPVLRHLSGPRVRLLVAHTARAVRLAPAGDSSRVRPDPFASTSLTGGRTAGRTECAVESRRDESNETGQSPAEVSCMVLEEFSTSRCDAVF